MVVVGRGGYDDGGISHGSGRVNGDDGNGHGVLEEDNCRSSMLEHNKFKMANRVYMSTTKSECLCHCQ